MKSSHKNFSQAETSDPSLTCTCHFSKVSNLCRITCVYTCIYILARVSTADKHIKLFIFHIHTLTLSCGYYSQRCFKPVPCCAFQRTNIYTKVTVFIEKHLESFDSEEKPHNSGRPFFH